MNPPSDGKVYKFEEGSDGWTELGTHIPRERHRVAVIYGDSFPAC